MKSRSNGCLLQGTTSKYPSMKGMLTVSRQQGKQGIWGSCLSSIMCGTTKTTEPGEWNYQSQKKISKIRKQTWIMLRGVMKGVDGQLRESFNITFKWVCGSVSHIDLGKRAPCEVVGITFQKLVFLVHLYQEEHATRVWKKLRLILYKNQQPMQLSPYLWPRAIFGWNCSEKFPRKKKVFCERFNKEKVQFRYNLTTFF